MKKIDNEPAIKVSSLIYAVLTIAVLFFAISMFLAFGTSTDLGANIRSKMMSHLPVPVAIVGWNKIVYFKDVSDNVKSIEKFYQINDFSKDGLRVDFGTDDGKKRLKIKEREIFDKLVEDKIIESLAKKRGLTISKGDIDKAISAKLKESGTSEKLKKDLSESYGWSVEDFKAKVVMPNAYQTALSLSVSQNDLENLKSKEKINQAKESLEEGKKFADVAKEYSEGSSKETGGEIGWIKKEQLAEELQGVVFSDEKIEKNSITESSIGFHIIEVEEKKKEDNIEYAKIRQIFVSKPTFADWLLNEKKKIRVTVTDSDYFWDMQNGCIEFRDEQMRNFEKKEREASQGDASIMF